MNGSLCARRLLTYSLILFAVTGCRDTPQVSVVRAGRARVEASVTGVTSGTVRAEQIAELAFGTVGRVKAVYADLGDTVRQNQVLAEVENGDLKSRLEVAKEELERSRRLSQDQALSRSTLIQAQAAYDAAVTAYEKSLIRAPYDGVIVERNLEVGQLSQITAVIPKAPLRIMDLGPRYVRVEIDEVDLSKVRVGMVAKVKILAIRREPFRAKVRKVLQFVSSLREQDRTSEIELEIEDEGQLLPPGASADVEVVTDAHENVLTIASKAILGRGDDRYVYVLRDGALHRAPIRIGIFGYATSEIVDGLTEGQEVVLPSDKLELTEGLRVTVKR